MRILVTNDDGIFAEGIYKLAKHMQNNGEVLVVAPDSERSATGHAITMRSPLTVKKVKFFDTEIEAYSINGTPADCVKMGIEALFKTRKPDVVISGINDEPNLGTDVIYSGTVSAAVESAIMDIPSIAVSMGSYEASQFDDAAQFTSELLRKIMKNNKLHNIVVNVNYPNKPKNEIKGAKITTLGIRKYDNAFIERKDPWGNVYYWMSGTVREMEQNPDSDIMAVNENYISITPIHFDLTNFEHFKELKKWDIYK
ncbi:MAG TPA: 5'/3'-nucleotidase SurE [Clostridia bacterium]|nr:5'/3'-nucleotidase SurE [Clostridia bacterium]